MRAKRKRNRRARKRARKFVPAERPVLGHEKHHTYKLVAPERVSDPHERAALICATLREAGPGVVPLRFDERGAKVRVYHPFADALRRAAKRRGVMVLAM